MNQAPLNHWLQARPDSGLLLVEDHRPGLPAKMKYFPFFLVWRAPWRAKPGKKGLGEGAIYPRAAAGTALPWAVIKPPPSGLAHCGGVAVSVNNNVNYSEDLRFPH